MQFADLDEGIRIGEDFYGDDDLSDLDPEAAGEQVALAPTLRVCGPCPGRVVLFACRARRGRL